MSSEITTHVLQEETPEVAIRPTFRKWVTVLCAVVNFSLAVGLPIALSVMFLDWQEAFQDSRARTAAIHATCVGILFAGGVIAGYFMNRFGARLTLMLGSLLASLGLFLSMFATSIDYLIVTTGVIAGSGFCLLQLPCIPCITMTVSHYQSVAISLCGIGGSLLYLVLPGFYRILVDHYSWRGAFIIISGMTLHTCMIGLFMTSWLPSAKRSPIATSSVLDHELDIDPEVNTDELNSSNLDLRAEKTTGLLNTLHIINNKSVQSDGLTLREHLDNEQADSGPKDLDNMENSQLIKSKTLQSDSSTSQQHDDIDCADTKPCSDKVENPTVPLLSKRLDTSQQIDTSVQQCTSRSFQLEKDGSHTNEAKAFSPHGLSLLQSLRTSKWRFMADPLFIFCLLFLSLTLATLFSFILLLMDFSRTKGFEDESDGVLCIQVTVIAGLVGKISAGLLNLFPRVHSFPLLCFYGCLGSAAMILLGNFTQFAAILSCLAVVGIGQGGIISIYPKCILDLETVNAESYPLAFGIACSVEGLFDIAIPVLTGHMVDVTGSYFLPLVILGTIAFLVSVMLALVYCIIQRRRMKEQSKVI